MEGGFPLIPSVFVTRSVSIFYCQGQRRIRVLEL